MEPDYNYYNDSDLQSQSTLILCIEELSDEDKPSLERRLFIGWDKDRSQFFIKGKVVDTSKIKYVPFSFMNDSKKNIYEFVKFVIDRNPFNIILYNYNNLYDKDINILPYEFFEHLLDDAYEIAGYDAVTLRREYIIRLLKMLKI